MNGSAAPRPATGQAGALSVLLPALHILLGCALLSIGTVLRLRGGVPFLLLGAWFAAVGIGLAGRRTWAWWSAEVGHPLFLIGEAVFLLVSFFLTKDGWKAEGMGKLGGIVMAFVFLGTLAAAFASLTTWFWLRRPMVRATFFRSNPGVPGGTPVPATRGLAAAVSLLVIGVLVFVIWGRALQFPRPPVQRYARSQTHAKTASAAASEDPCSSRFLSLSGAIVFTPDASRFVGNTGRVACVWEVATGRRIAAIAPGGSGSIANIAVSPDGRLLALIESRGREGGRIVLSELATGRRASTIAIPVAGARSFLAFGPTAATIVAQTAPGTLGVFDSATGNARSTWPSDGPGSIRPVVLSPNRNRVAFASDGRGPVRVAEVETGQIHALDLSPAPLPRSRVSRAPPAADSARIESILFSRDARTLYVGRFQSVAVLDLADWKERPSLELSPGARWGSLTPLSVSADGSRLLTEMGGYLFPIFALPGGELVTIGAPHVAVGSEPAPLFLEGRLVSVASWGRMVGVNGRVVSVSLLPRESMSVGSPGNRGGPAQSPQSAVSPDGTLLVLAIGELSNLTLWNAATDRWIDMLSKPGSYGPMIQPVFSPDGRVLAVSGSHGIDVWDVPDRKLLYRIGGRDRN